MRPLQVPHEQHDKFIHEPPALDVLQPLDDAIVNRGVRRRRHHPHRKFDVGHTLGRPFEEASHLGEYRRVRLFDLSVTLRKSQGWEAELHVVETERARLEHPRLLATPTGATILQLAKQSVFL